MKVKEIGARIQHVAFQTSRSMSDIGDLSPPIEHAQSVVTLDNARMVLDRIHHTCELRDPTESRSLHLWARLLPSQTLGTGNSAANSEFVHV
jgi:hypothetical protein